MSKRTWVASAVGLLSVIFWIDAASPDITLVPVVKVHAQSEVAASRTEVWSTLTAGKNLVAWCPYWEGEANMKVNLTKIGDKLEFKDSWGNEGLSVVTYLDRDSELRVAHEPEDGSYLCQVKLRLSVAGNNTRIDYWEMYTDASAEKDRIATAKKLEKEAATIVATLKELSEKK